MIKVMYRIFDNGLHESVNLGGSSVTGHALRLPFRPLQLQLTEPPVVCTREYSPPEALPPFFGCIYRFLYILAVGCTD